MQDVISNDAITYYRGHKITLSPLDPEFDGATVEIAVTGLATFQLTLSTEKALEFAKIAIDALATLETV